LEQNRSFAGWAQCSTVRLLRKNRTVWRHAQVLRTRFPEDLFFPSTRPFVRGKSRYLAAF